jgi:hypothetical protein
VKLRTVPLIGALSIVGLGLIGLGAHATFTTNTSSGQTITAGTYDPTLVGTCASGTNCPVDTDNNLFTLSPDHTVLTFTPETVGAASFTTGDEEVTATNTGNLPVSDPTWVVNATGGSDLASQAYVCATSTGIGTDDTNYVLYNGPLSDFTGTSYSLSGDVLTPTGPPTATSGPSDNLVIDVYAGGEPTLCGAITTPGTAAAPGTSSAPTLNNAADGENVSVTVQLTYQD